MKTNKLFLVLTGFLLLVSTLGLASACKHNDYSDLSTNDEVIFIIKNSNQDNYGSTYWENEDRLPVNDYKNGYSYRATKDYRELANERIFVNTYAEYDDSYYNSRYDSRRIYSRDNVEYYYTYDDYMRKYTKYECYSNPPRNKLFYIECP